MDGKVGIILDFSGNCGYSDTTPKLDKQSLVKGELPFGLEILELLHTVILSPCGLSKHACMLLWHQRSSGKYWLTYCKHMLHYKTSRKENTTTNLIRKVRKFWQAVKLILMNTHFPKFGFCLKALFLSVPMNHVVFLEVSFFFILEKYLTSMCLNTQFSHLLLR